MEEKHIDELRLKEKTYWWHVNKRKLVLKFLAQQDLLVGRILEVGCGGGFLSSLLAQAGTNVVAVDVLFETVRSLKSKGVIKSLAFDANDSWPLKSQSFHAVIMLDVLEHIKNDMVCLQETRRVLRSGGIAILTVPAHKFLFSSWDKVLGHHRRYSKSELLKKVKESGFHVKLVSYQNALSLLPALVLRSKDRFAKYERERAEFPEIPEIVNRCLKWWGHLECFLIPPSLPVGLSLFMVLRSY